MSYLALYRRFRPQVFKDLIGQETVVRALMNQIKTDKIGHAYLFCGARGTGKTTAAKIFARAINCENANDAPCGSCAACRSLADPNTLDIVEMDAASNNRVENVREIREKVQYPPVAGRFKVYIIDEVHMLTTEAFNALLKTLEEPPKHAVFILATTEPHKLPATILSRCMRFDFKLIPTKKIAELIAEIFDKEGKEYEAEAITAIAKAGEGSVRDALSVADICLSYKPEKLTYSDVIEVLGSSDRAKTAKLVQAIFLGDTGTALSVVDELIGLGKNVGMLIKDVLGFLRDVMVVQTCSMPEAILAMPKEDIDELKSIAAKSDNHGILRTVEIFSKIENDVKYSTHPRIIFETAVVKATNASADYNIDALISRISKLEAQLKAITSGEIAVRAKEELKPNQAQVVVETVKEEKPIQPKIVEREQVEAVKEVEVKTETAAIKEKVVEKIAEKPSNSTAFEQVRAPRLSRAERLKNDLMGILGQEEEQAPPMDLFDAFNKPSAPISKAEMVQVQQDKKPESQPEQAKEAEKSEVKVETPPRATVADKRIWGTVIRKLRESGNAVLWVICQELDAKVENAKLTITAKDKMEYDALVKPSNLDALKKVVATLCDYAVEVNLIGEKGEDSFPNDIETIKSVIGNIEVEE